MSSRLQYEPTSEGTAAAARLFAISAHAWELRRKEAERAVFDAATIKHSDGSTQKPLGIISKDQLNMSVCALIFARDPGAGFTTAPLQVQQALRHADSSKSVPAGAVVVFPDVNTAVGAKVLQQMRELSAVNEDRPLLDLDNAGIRSVVVEGNKLLFSTARISDDDPTKVIITAAKTAVQPQAEIKHLGAEVTVLETADRPRNRMH